MESSNTLKHLRNVPSGEENSNPTYAPKLPNPCCERSFGIRHESRRSSVQQPEACRAFRISNASIIRTRKRRCWRERRNVRLPSPSPFLIKIRDLKDLHWRNPSFFIFDPQDVPDRPASIRNILRINLRFHLCSGGFSSLLPIGPAFHRTALWRTSVRGSS